MQAKPLISNLERQEQLLNFVQQNQRATVAQISERFSVSLATVRRDLEALAEAANARRRWEFLLTVAPLPVGGGTGSPVNPIATF